MLSYLLNRSFHHISHDVAFLLLTKAQDTTNCLTLNRRVPLRLEKMDSTRHRQVIESHCTCAEGHEEYARGFIRPKYSEYFLPLTRFDLSVNPMISNASLGQKLSKYIKTSSPE